MISVGNRVHRVEHPTFPGLLGVMQSDYTAIMPYPAAYRVLKVSPDRCAIMLEEFPELWFDANNFRSFDPVDPTVPLLWTHDPKKTAETEAAARNPVIAEQAPPKDSGKADCWLLVVKDMEDRRQHGIEKYGQPVMVDNGRDPLIDAYQEALDLCVYLRQEIEKRASK